MTGETALKTQRGKARHFWDEDVKAVIREELL